MKKTLVAVGVTALLGYLAVCGFMYFEQDGALLSISRSGFVPALHALRLKRGAAMIKVWELHPTPAPD